MRLAFIGRGKSPEVGPAQFGTAGWKAAGYGQAPTEQIGAYAGSMLNQFPAYYNQPQMGNGVSRLSSHWYTPTVSVVPTFEQTQQLAYYPGAQRNASKYGGPVGPISANSLRARVTAAQVRQSGASALSWARQLTGG